MGDEEITITGEVRYSGLVGAHPHPQDVDLEVTLFDGDTVDCQSGRKYRYTMACLTQQSLQPRFGKR